MNNTQNWIFPAAGLGKRTIALGEYKPFLVIAKEKSIYWFFKSIKKHIKPNDKLIYITTRYFEKKYNVKKVILDILKRNEIFNKIEFVLVPETPPGPALSVYSAQHIVDSSPTFVINCDQFIIFDPIQKIESESIYLPVNLDFGESKSYVSIVDNRIIKIVEKENISNIASSGVYVVSNGIELMKAIETMIDNDEKINNEYFVGPALNYLIEKGFNINLIPVNAKIDLGNVKGIQELENIIRELKK